MSNSEYQAGVCNIGGPEVARRKQVSIFGLIAFLIASVGLISGDASSGLRLVVFIPAMLFAVGYFQARRKFCFAFGLMGTFNFGELGKLSKVASPEAIAADRRAAIGIIVQSLLLALSMSFLVASI